MDNAHTPPAFPPEAIEYAGFVLLHCAVIADANRDGELICPFAVITDDNGRHVVDFESDTQEEGVSKGWASLAEAKSQQVWWAFGREGIDRSADGSGIDVIMVTVWTPHMTRHNTVLQRFGRTDDEAIYLIGEPDVVEHGEEFAESVGHWDRAALDRGIASHPKGARWSRWRPQ